MSTFEYRAGDLCIYTFDASRCMEKIVRVVDEVRGIAEISICDVFIDNSGDDLFCYLMHTGKTMRASLAYLKKIEE